MEQIKNNNSDESVSNVLPIVSAVFSVCAFGIFLYAFFGDVEEVIKKDAVYWFLISLSAAVLPQIKQIRFKDFEVKLKEQMHKHREELEQRMDNLQVFMSSADMVNLSESNMPEEVRDARNRVFNDFNKRLQRADHGQRLDLQERFTLMHLMRFGIALSDVKAALAKAGVYNGEISNEFDGSTAEAIQKFQELNGLEVDGIFGPMAYKLLASELSQGS